ncbi:ammonium transporter [Desulfovibrio sp. OttesenSCG-928-G15]|nr:ammonium transporter [Desulfovibrio sp. OttesenSCG-928-G15]
MSSAADVGFMIVCSGLVMLMVPGLALFYGGLVQKRNVLSTTMHSFFMLGLASLFWAVIGYSLAFGGDVLGMGLIGNLDYFMLSNVGMSNNGPVDNLPHVLFMIFQCMFAALTPALISGAYAERIRFPAMALFSLLWLLFVYSPLAHWVWGGGWLGKLGALDFAGGAVVHMSSGAAALAAAQALGPRKSLSEGGAGSAPHNLPMTIFGAGLLWFGWFGFNAGSATAASALAANALVTTQLAAATGILGWLLVEARHSGKPTTLGAASGALAGLVAITPAAGFVSPCPAMLIGFVGGVVCYGGILLKRRFHYDDALDVVGIHGIGGTWGALATGLFASAAINGANGLFYGDSRQFVVQVISIVATWVFAYTVSRLILFLVSKITPLRCTDRDELMGLDISEHNERGYNL